MPDLYSLIALFSKGCMFLKKFFEKKVSSKVISNQTINGRKKNSGNIQKGSRNVQIIGSGNIFNEVPVKDVNFEEKKMETKSLIAKEILGKLEQREHIDWFKTDDIKVGHGFFERLTKLADSAQALSDQSLNDVFELLKENSQMSLGSQAILQFPGSEGKAKAEAYSKLGLARASIEKNYQDIRNRLNEHLMFRK